VLAVAWGPAAFAEGGFSLHLDKLTIGNQYVDVDTDSSKFGIPRRSERFVVPELTFSGERRRRALKVRRQRPPDDARHGLLYDVATATRCRRLQQDPASLATTATRSHRDEPGRS
jgi:hypothetical protein